MGSAGLSCFRPAGIPSPWPCPWNKSRVRQHFVEGLLQETWPSDVIWIQSRSERKGCAASAVNPGAHGIEGSCRRTAAEIDRLHAEIAFEHRVQVRADKYRIADVAVIYPSGLVEVHEVQLAGITQSEMETELATTPKRLPRAMVAR